MKPLIFCLTPVKNEEWIIDFFLRHTSNWADKIIIADQQSTDLTLLFANKFSKVKIIINNNAKYDEGYRQRLLLAQARKSGMHLLFALDADEMLSPGFEDTNDWQRIINSRPGEAFYFQWVNLMPDLKHYWTPPLWFNFAYHDDGAVHKGQTFHSPRLPLGKPKNRVYLHEIKIFHHQYLDWNRMAMKQKWYQVQEYVNNRRLNPVALYRKYHHMDSAIKRAFVIPSGMIDNNLSFEYRKLIKKSVDIGYYWNNLIIDLIKGREKEFSDVAVWPMEGLSDPRNGRQKLLHSYLQITQKYLSSRIISKLDNMLSLDIR